MRSTPIHNQAKGLYFTRPCLEEHVEEQSRILSLKEETLMRTIAPLYRKTALAVLVCLLLFGVCGIVSAGVIVSSSAYPPDVGEYQTDLIPYPQVNTYLANLRIFGFSN